MGGTSHWPLMDPEEARWVRPTPPPDEEIRHRGPGTAERPHPELSRMLGWTLLLAFGVLALLALLGWL